MSTTTLDGPQAGFLSFLQELTLELEQKHDVIQSLQETAELLSLENHPAKQTVEVRLRSGCLYFGEDEGLHG